MPPQSITSRAGGQTVVRLDVTTLVPLDHMIDLPVTTEVPISPTSLLELDRVAAKAAMPLRLFPDASQLTLDHGNLEGA